MKRWLVALMALAIVLMSAAAVWAGPTDVGGTFSSQSKTTGPAVFKGKGNPQGAPFQTADVVLMWSPTDVGGT